MSDLLVNFDNSFFFSWHPPAEHSRAGILALVDQFAETHVTDLQFCLNAQRSSVACASRQSVWDGYDPEADNGQPFFADVAETPLFPGMPSARQHMRTWVHACWSLHRDGIDPYTLWLERTRRQGMRAWLSMRMNDVHYVNRPNHCIHDCFWRENRNLRRDPDGDGYNGQCLDYAQPRVREYQLRYAREMIGRYDMDGFELDWMRNPHYFRPGREREGAALLTSFLADVRELLRARATALGHPIRLGVRVPAHPETAVLLGFDVAEWARRGLVDTVVVSSFLHHEYDAPMAPWRDMLGGTAATLVGGMMSVVHAAGGRFAHTPEMARGAAASLLTRGAEAISLFNFFDCRPYGTWGDAYRQSPAGRAYARLMRQLGEPELLTRLTRRHVLTGADCRAPGQVAAAPLPVDVDPNGRVERRICVPTLHAGQRLRLRLGGPDADAINQLRASVNRVACRPWATEPEAAHGPILRGCEVEAIAIATGDAVIRLENPGDGAVAIDWMELAVIASGDALGGDEVDAACAIP